MTTSVNKKVLELWKTSLTWDSLAFHAEGRLVLRHNKNLQFGYTIKPSETLEEALRYMEDYCKKHPKGNPKITGFIKVVEHTTLNNVPLPLKIRQFLDMP